MSRTHAHFTRKNGLFFISDNNSKFGTLALIKQPALINSICNNVFQVGKTLFLFEIKQEQEELTFREQLKYIFNCFSTNNDWLCCSGNAYDYEESKNKKKLQKEMIEDKPYDLETHDGIIHFPREFMPE